LASLWTGVRASGRRGPSPPRDAVPSALGTADAPTYPDSAQAPSPQTSPRKDGPQPRRKGRRIRLENLNAVGQESRAGTRSSQFPRRASPRPTATVIATRYPPRAVNEDHGSSGVGHARPPSLWAMRRSGSRRPARHKVVRPWLFPQGQGDESIVEHDRTWQAEELTKRSRAGKATHNQLQWIPIHRPPLEESGRLSFVCGLIGPRNSETRKQGNGAASRNPFDRRH
jgi:hypothetical protein